MSDAGEDIDSGPDVRPVLEEGAAAAAAADGDPPMTKSRMKKLRKQAELKARHAERKARQKLARAELKAKRDAGELPPDVLPPRKKRKVAPAGTPTPFPARVVIDLGFDDKMLEKECKSLTSQLAYAYNSNRKSMNPFSSLLFTSLSGKTHTRLESLADGAYKRWHGTEWWTDGLEKLWTEDEPGADPRQTKASRETVVYLTADADDDVEELKEGETYVIGGLCDHNRYKYLCLNKAKQLNIRAARLPIGKYIENLPSRKVLTVNQCYDILLGWLEYRDWENAFHKVIPARKFRNPDGTVANGKIDNDVEEPEDDTKTSDQEAPSGDENEATIDTPA